ncbi:MAG: hypothetical protein IKB71_07475 [Lentisphaeria bacterium]|nr:hypothetical protein [Lentisphaeria bacterium]
MTPWQKLNEDLLNNPDFAEVAEINGRSIRVLASSIEFAENFNEYGMEQSENFYLRCDRNVTVHRGDPVTFRGRKYKVLNFSIASDNSSKNIYLKNFNA